MIKITTREKLRIIFKSVNPNIVKAVKVTCHSNHVPARLDWYQFQIGIKTYIVYVWDTDPEYEQDNIKYMEELLKEFQDIIIREPYEYYFRCNKINLSGIPL